MARTAPAELRTYRLSRSALLRSTALQAAFGLVLALPAAAQPAVSARPTGGQVVAGAATITSTAAATNIAQSSNRAAIDWTSFNVGSGQSVNYQQPGATAVTLNRVTGPDPSAIAGKITANGQIVITNQNGVTFYQGSEVNAQSVIVSAAGISNQNFMAGKMAFDQAANPNARIVNNGTITVKQAGLAALVAPAVANNGTINAKLGQVILAGAAAHTLDMYGDGLVSIDVTKQVLTAPAPDGKKVTALVTNTGVIQADGGVVQLTAAAADGVVQTLVRAGGRIQANTAGTQTGRIEITGTGGSVVVEGRVAADGRGSGLSGGQVMIAGSDTTTIASGAHVSATGRAGGGLVAIGTTLARAAGSGAAPSGTSSQTVVAGGARVSVSGRGTGSGGRITVLSTQSTSVAGTLTAKGGKTGGNGGTIELSGEAGFSLTGHADTSAPHGTAGQIILDPRDLTIEASGTNNVTPTGSPPTLSYTAGGTNTDATVTPAELEGLTGSLTLQATRNLVVASSLTYTGSVTMAAGNNLTVNPGVSIVLNNTTVGQGTVGSVLSLTAAAIASPGYTAGGTLSLQGSLQAATIALGAGTGGISIGGAITTSIGYLSFNTTGAITQAATAPGITAANGLYGTAQSAAFLSTANQVSIAGAQGSSGTPFTTTTGGFSLVTSVPLTVGAAAGNDLTPGVSGGIAVPAGQQISLTTDSLTLQGTTSLNAPGGTVSLQPFTATNPITISQVNMSGGLVVTPAELATVVAGTLQLGNNTALTGTISFGQAGSNETVDLVTNGNFATVNVVTGGAVAQGGPLLVNNLTVQAASVTLTTAGNAIPSFTGNATSGISVSTSNDLVLPGATSGGAVSLLAGGNVTVAMGGSVSGSSVTLSAGDASITNPSAAASLVVKGPVTATGPVTLGAGTGGIALAANVTLSTINGVAPALTVDTTGPLTQTAGGVTAGDLNGNAASVSLPSRTNAIQGVASQNANFTVTDTAGNFTLVDSVPLTVGGPSVFGGLSVQTGQTISLTADSLTIVPIFSEGESTSLSATGGTLVITPFTAGTGVLLTSSTKPGGVLALTTDELSQVSADTLQIGQTTGTSVGAVTFGQAGETIDLGSNGGFTHLVINATGAVTQGGPLGVTSIAGSAASVQLNDEGNFIQTLAGFATTSGDFSLHTSSGLTVTGAVNANGGTGNITLSAADVADSDTGAGLILTQNLTGATVSLNSLTGNPSVNAGISQTGGIITATTLTGAGYFADLLQSNAVGKLADFATTFELDFTTTLPLQVTGAVSSAQYRVTLNAAGITQTAASSITAPELDGSSSADTILTSRNNAVASIGTFAQTAGNFSLTTSSPALGFTSTDDVSATTGSLTFVADNINANPGPTDGLSAPDGIITFAPFTASRRTEVIGSTAADPASLSLSQDFLNTITAAQAVQLGNASTTGAINLGNAGETITIPANAALLLQTTGAVTQGISPGERNGGGTLALITSNIAGTVGNLALQAPANQIIGLGYATIVPGGLSGLASTGSILVTTSTSLGLVNTVSANAASGTLSVSAAGSLTTAAGPFTASAISLSAGTGDLTLFGAITTGGTLNTVSLTSNSGNVVAGNAAITTGQLAASGGTVTATNAGNAIGALYTVSATGNFSLADTLPVSLNGVASTGGFSINDSGGAITINNELSATSLAVTTPGALTESGNGILRIVNSLSGSAASVALGAGNNFTVGSIGNFTTTGDFTLGSGEPTAANTLAVSGTLSVGGNLTLTNSGPVTLSGSLSAANIAITASSTQNVEAAFPNNADGTITQTAGSVTAANQVTLSAGDVFSQTGGSIAATGAAGTVSIGSQGGLGLGGTVSAPVSVSLNAVTRSYGVDYGQETQTDTGVITQPGGGITTALLKVQSASTATLTSATNSVTSLASSTSGGLSFTDGAVTLQTAGISDATAVTLNSAGSIVIASAVTAGALSLTAANSLSQTSGAITAATLTGSAGVVTLNGTSNAITALDAFTTTNNFTLADSVPLSIAGAVSVGSGQTLTLFDDQPSFAAGGSLSAPSGTVALREFTTGNGVTLNGSGVAGSSAVTAQTLSVGALTGGPISITGFLDLTTVNTLNLLSGQAISESGNGAISVPTLTGQGASLALGGSNEIQTLGAFSTTGAFNLVNAEALTISGPVTASSVTVSAVAGMTVSGGITAPTVALSTTDAATQTDGGTFAVPGVFVQTAGTISGSTSVTVTSSDSISQSAGAVITAGTGTLSLSAHGPLTLGGADSGGPVNLTAVNKSRRGPNGTTVNTTGDISQTAGALTATTLTVIGNSVLLAQPGNAIATVTTGPFTGATPAFTLTDSQALTAGTPSTVLETGTTVLTVTTGGLSLGGFVSATSLALSVAGAVTETPNGSLDLSSPLSGTAGSINLPTNILIPAIGSLTTATGLRLVNSGALTINGPVTDGQSIALSAQGLLTVAGNVTAPAVSLASTNGFSVTGGISQTFGTIAGSTSVLLTSAAGISQSGGGITTASLSGTAGGAATLTASANQVTALAGFSSAGGFSLVDGRGLGVTGTVSDTTTVNLNVTGPLALGAKVSGPSGVTLNATGAITQSAGGIVGPLTGSAASAALTATGNAVPTLNAFTTTGSFTLADSVALSVAGPVATGSGQTLTLLDDSPTIASGGSLSAPGGTVILAAFTPGGGFTLGGPGSFDATSDITAQTLQVGTSTGGPVTVTGAFNLSNVPVLDLESAGAITETGGGAVRVATLTGNGASAALGGANQVGTLGSFTVANAFALTNGQTLAVTGPLTAASASLSVTGGLGLSGNVTAPTGLSLTASGAITQSAGAVATASLTGSAASVTLSSAANGIAAIGPFSSTNGFSLVDGVALSVVGPLTDASSVSLSTAAGLALNAAVQTAALSLTAGGAITQPGGSITASSLTGSAGSAALTARGNSVATLGSFASQGSFALTDSVPLTIGNAVSAGGGGTLTLTADAPSFTGSGSLNAPGGTVALREFTAGRGITLSGTPSVSAATLSVGSATGGPVTIAGALTLASGTALDLESGGLISETGSGAITAASVTGNGASVALGGANQIGTLGQFAAAGAFSVSDSQALAVTGPLTGSAISLSAVGNLTLSGAIDGINSVSLSASGAITQTGGSIVTASLTGAAASAALTSTANSVTALAGFSTTGNLSFYDGRSLTVTGPVDPNVVRLTVAGDLALASTVTGGTVALNASGAITQSTAGIITASVLTGGANTANLTGANQIAVLGDFQSTAGLTLTTAQPLAVTGTVTDGKAVTLSSAGMLTLSGSVTTPLLSLSTSAGGPVSQTAGAIKADTLTIASAGGLSQTGGTLTAGTLTGSSTGQIALGTGGVANIAAIGNLSSTAGISVRDAGPLQLDGTLSAPSLAVAATGQLVLTGGVLAIANGASVLQVLAGPNGLATLRQTGLTSVIPISATPTLLIDLPAAGGTLTLNNLQASSVNLALSMGSGTASGNLAVGSLSLFASGGSAAFLGSVDGQTGFFAAQISAISPRENLAYTLNGCAISAVSCSVQSSILTDLQIAASEIAISVLRPDILSLDVLDLSVTRDRDDPTLLLPNISDRDY